LLAPEAGRIRLRELIRQRAGRERARAVGAVAVDLSPGVDDHRRAGLDDRVGRARVRARTVGPAGDDRLERGARCAELVEEVVEPPRKLALGAAGEPLLGEAFVGLAGDPCGFADRVRSEEHTSELQSLAYLVCRLL